MARDRSKDKDRDKKKKNRRIDPNIVDYYKLYDLDRGADRKTLLGELRSKQGDIKQKMSAGSLNKPEIMEKLAHQDKMIAEAIKIFKSDEKLEEYNEMLDAAYAAGTIDTTAQTANEDELEEIERLFLKGNYQGVIRICKEKLSAHGANATYYSYMARSYYVLDQFDEAMETIETFVKNVPKNAEALDLGVRFSILGANDPARAQGYLNRIVDTFGDCVLAVVDQIYIHLAQNNLDLAFNMTDYYLAQNPSDQTFRRTVAMDMVGFCQRLYKYVEGHNDMLFLTSPQDYARCKAMADKAASIFKDDTIEFIKAYTDVMGEEEYNEDNRANIRWSLLATYLYTAPGAIALASGSFSGIFLFILGGLCLAATVGLHVVSRRPYWQVYKYYLTGEREPMEQIFVRIGNILAGYMRWSFKIAWKMFVFIMHLAGL